MPEIQKLEVCVSNWKRGSKAAYETLKEESPALKLRRYGCLGQCHICIRRPFFLVNDKDVVDADNADDLVSAIRTYRSQ